MAELAQMKLLVNLAYVDGEVTDHERNYIVNIGRANGIYPDQITPLLAQPHPSIVPNNLTPDEKFKYIFSLVQLMKIDERMYKEEILFCSQIATKLGYGQQAILDLMVNVKSSEMPSKELEALKTLTNKHLRK